MKARINEADECSVIKKGKCQCLVTRRLGKSVKPVLSLVHYSAQSLILQLFAISLCQFLIR